MIVLKRLALLTLILGSIIAIAITVKAHWRTVDVGSAHLYFEENPELTCDINGKRFTHTKVTKDGKILVEFWHERPRTPKFTVTAKAHGRGWAFMKISGNIDGKPFGDDNNWTKSEKIGRWPKLLAFAWDGNSDLEHFVMGDFYYPPKVYKWKGKGTIKLVPWRWQWRLALLGSGGEWKAAEKEHHTELSHEPSGSWTVERNWSVEGSRSKEIPNNDEENDEENEEEQEKATPPDTPSFNLTPSRYAILLKWSDANDGGSPITDYQYKKRSSRSNGKYWSSWSSWTSAGTGNSTWIKGLSRDVTYAVRMRAVNAIGTSSGSGTQTTKTRK